MNFFQILKSLNELLFEVISWMLFYPITLWRSIRHPLRMTDYVGTQLAEDVADPFDDVLAPPVFLLLSVILAHAVELAMIGQSQIIDNTNGIAAVISDNTSLILLRLIAFAVFPVIVAAYSVRRRRNPLTRTNVVEPFFAQCYVTAPLTLAASIAVSLVQVDRRWATPLAATLLLATGLAWLAVEGRWLSRRLEVSSRQGFAHAALVLILCWGALLLLGFLVLGPDF